MRGGRRYSHRGRPQAPLTAQPANVSVCSTPMNVHPVAGTPATGHPDQYVPRLVTAYDAEVPDPLDTAATRGVWHVGRSR